MINGNFARFCSVVGLALVSSGVSGCATPASASAPGELELVLAGGSATYAIDGRVRLVPVDSSDATAPEVFAEVPERSRRLALPAGVYLLTLNDGARLTCPGDEHDADEPARASHIVAAQPQRIVITPGARTTARLGFGSRSSRGFRGASAQAGSQTSGDPCEGHALAPSSVLALSGPAPTPDVDAR